MKETHGLTESIIELFKIPLTYLNLLVVGISFSDIESGIKILVYILGIAASLYSIKKTRMEIKKLNQKEDI